MDINLLILIGFIVVVLVVVVILGIILARNSRPRRRTQRRYQRAETGELIGIGGTRIGEPVTLEGKGSYSGGSAQLQTGYYVISYELDTPTRVALIAEQDGDEETLLMSSGVGVKEFTVEAPGRYLWRVEPNIQSSKWRLVYRPVQRRAR